MLFIIYFIAIIGVALSINVNWIPSSTPHYCFKKVSTGERLVAYDVSRIIVRNSVSGCEQECNIYKCTHFSFGLIANRNGTCELTTGRQVSRRQDPNFDLYERTSECLQGKPTGYEQACYRRLISGKRLHDRFIRHSLPCNSLEACQHQCSIEKHFECSGFNIRLDPARVGRGICELSSIGTPYLDQSRDFVFDPEFAYYERVYSNDSPNCGFLHHSQNLGFHQDSDGNLARHEPANGGPYYGGDSYGPWSTGYGTSNHGPWGSRGYGSGFYETNNPLRGPLPSFQPNTPFRVNSYGYGGDSHIRGDQSPKFEYHSNNNNNNRPTNWLYHRYFGDDHKRFNGPSRNPTYIIIDADANDRKQGREQNGLLPSNPNLEYLPPKNTFLNDQHHLSTPQSLPTSPENRVSEHQTITPVPKTSVPGTSVIDNVSTLLPSSRSNQRPQPQNVVPGSQDVTLRPHVYPAKPEELPPKLPTVPSPRPVQVSPLPQPPPQSQPRPFSQAPSIYHPPRTFSYRPSDKSTNALHSFGHEVCFQRAHPGFRLNQDTIRKMIEAPSVLECEAMCTGSSFKCTGYSFRYSTGSGDTPNCLLTDFNSLAPETNLLPDRSCDVYFKMNSCLDVDRTTDTGISECELACLNAFTFTCRTFTYRYGTKVIGEPNENCFLSDWPITALSLEDFVLSPNYDIYERGSYGHGCELDEGTTHIGPAPSFISHPVITEISHSKGTWNIDETWRHFTVNGWPCKIGSQCQLNTEAGFWYCEVEGGDKTQWDYCCRPKHACGYSKGYNYPWCYVGEAGPEQWRPCSEQYYPEFDNHFHYKPVKGHNPILADSYGPPRDARPWNFGDDFGPPSYWPISYLYAGAPPNETYIWDEDEPYSFHEDHHDSEHIVLDPHHYHQEYNAGDSSPTIKFKPCGHKFPYPKAIVQKLDLKNNPKATDPEEQMIRDKKSKKFEPSSNESSADVILGFSSNKHIQKKEKDEINQTPTEGYLFNNITDTVVSEKREAYNASEPKSKKIIKAVDAIIQHSLQEDDSSSGNNKRKEIANR